MTIPIGQDQFADVFVEERNEKGQEGWIHVELILAEYALDSVELG